MQSQMTEAEWWERYSDIATQQWELTPALNRIVRRSHLEEMRTVLFREGGSLLEIGCGSGWAGIAVAGDSMCLTGVDSSPRQLRKAREHARRAGLTDARFFCGTTSTLPPDHRFDAILIHAVLHHMRDGEIAALLENARGLLRDDGVLYIYEPLCGRASSMAIRLAGWAASILVWSPFEVLHSIGCAMKIGPTGFRHAAANGWTGMSPEERPLDEDWLLENVRRCFAVTQRPRYWHAFGLALAMGTTELTSLPARVAEGVVVLLSALDRVLLATGVRYAVRGVWTWASLTARPR